MTNVQWQSSRYPDTISDCPHDAQAYGCEDRCRDDQGGGSTVTIQLLLSTCCGSVHFALPRFWTNIRRDSAQANSFTPPDLWGLFRLLDAELGAAGG